MIKLTAAKCPQCGADIEVNPELEKSICQYCGTTILVQEAIQKIELSGTVKVAGIKNRDDYLDQAKKHFKVGEYLEAKECLANIINEDSFDIEAYCELIKNDIELMKKENFNIKLSKGNGDYNFTAGKYYKEYTDTIERILKIDENNERDKYFGTLKEDVDKIEADRKEIEERLEKNKEIVNRLNDDYNKIKEYFDFYNYQIADEESLLNDYRKLIGETFHTTSYVDQTYYDNQQGNYTDRYMLDSFSRITQDGIIYMNYSRTTSKYADNPKIVELYWENKSLPVERYEEIDERFNEYCSKIDPIIEECKQKREKLDNKYEKNRKKHYRKVKISQILCIIFCLLLVAAHVYVFIEAGIGGLIIFFFFVDSWVLNYILVPWMDKISAGLNKYDKKKKK